MEKFFITAHICSPEELNLVFSYIYYDKDTSRPFNGLALEREYIYISKKYNADITNTIKGYKNSCLINTNIDGFTTQNSIFAIQDWIAPEFINDIITDHVTPARISKWVGRALNSISPPMRMFNRQLLSYLYYLQIRREYVKI